MNKKIYISPVVKVHNFRPTIMLSGSISNIDVVGDDEGYGESETKDVTIWGYMDL